jgi:hypothetical protein
VEPETDLVDEAAALEHGEVVGDISRRAAELQRQCACVRRLVQRVEDLGAGVADEPRETHVPIR